MTPTDARPGEATRAPDEIIRRAEEALDGLCSGRQRFTMTVPPDDCDQDMRFADLIALAHGLLYSEPKQERDAIAALIVQFGYSTLGFTPTIEAAVKLASLIAPMTDDSADGTPREVNRLVFDTAADANRYLVAAHTKAELIELVIAQTNAAAAAQTQADEAVPEGRCSVCHERRRLRRDGMVRWHQRWDGGLQYGSAPRWRVCEGYGHGPAIEQAKEG